MTQQLDPDLSVRFGTPQPAEPTAAYSPAAQSPDAQSPSRAKTFDKDDVMVVVSSLIVIVVMVLGTYKVVADFFS